MAADAKKTLVVEIEAELAKAKADVAKFEKQLAKIDAEIPISADTTDAKRDIDGLLAKVDKLGGEAGMILLRTNAEDIAVDITRLVGEIDKLDASDPTVDVKATQVAELNADLDRIAGKVKEVNATPIDLNTTGARQGLDDIGRSASSSKSVLANMIGNTTQDLGALAGVAGSAGVAIGQMGEYMADASADGDKLGTVLGNFGKVAGPLAALALAAQAFQVATDNLNLDKKFQAGLVDDFNKGLRDSVGIVQTLQDKIRETGKLEFVQDPSGPLAFRKSVQDLIPQLDKLGLSYKQFTDLVADTDVTDMQVVIDDLLHAMGDPTAKQLEGTNQAVRDVSDAIVEYRKSADGAKVSTEALNRVMGISTEEVKDSIRAWERARDPAAALPREFAALARMWEQNRTGSKEFNRALETMVETLGLTKEQVYDLLEAEKEREKINGRADQQEAARFARKRAEQREIQDAIAAQNDAEEEAVRLAEERADAIADAEKEALQATKDHIQALYDLNDAQRDAFDNLVGGERSFFSAAKAQDEFSDSLAEVPEDLKKAKKESKNTADALRNQGLVYDNIAGSALSLAETHRDIAESMATARGETLSAADAQRALYNSLVNSAREAKGKSRDAILDLIAALSGLDKKVITDVVLKPPTKEEAAQALADVVPKASEVPITVTLSAESIAALELAITGRPPIPVPAEVVVEPPIPYDVAVLMEETARFAAEELRNNPVPLPTVADPVAAAQAGYDAAVLAEAEAAQNPPELPFTANTTQATIDVAAWEDHFRRNPIPIAVTPQWTISPTRFGPPIITPPSPGGLAAPAPLALGPAPMTASAPAVTNRYSINVQVPPTVNPAEIGERIVEAIRQYERRSGKGWRVA